MSAMDYFGRGRASWNAPRCERCRWAFRRPPEQQERTLCLPCESIVAAANRRTVLTQGRSE